MKKITPTELTREKLITLGAERLADFIVEQTSRNAKLNEAATRMISYSIEPSGIYHSVVKQVRSIIKSKRFYDWRDADELDGEVASILNTIREELYPVSASDAVLALQFLTDKGGLIIEKVDTSNGTVYPHLQEAVDFLGQIWTELPVISQINISQFVYEKIEHNGYGIFDEIIFKFKQVLGKTGLRALEKSIRKQLSQVVDDFDKYKWIHALKDIADVEQDVDKFIMLSQEFNQGNPEYAYRECAKRLADAGRAEEALALLENVKSSAAWQSDIDKTMLRCYEVLGRHEDIQKVRERRFFEYPSKESLQHLLVCIGDLAENRTLLIEQAIQKNSSVYTCMDFLVELKESNRLATYVRSHISEWDGDRYYSLAPAAAMLEAKYPFEASLLYRALLDSILTRANSKYYHHGARYYQLLMKLEPEVKNYSPLISHGQYFAELSERHKRKSAFWGRVKESSATF